MAAVDYSKLNVYQKLNIARQMFIKSGTKKTGKNFSIGYAYFELEDIVPVATDIFNEVGIITIVSFTEERGMMLVMNTDNPTPEQSITFQTPMRYADTNKGTNAVQALGSTHTYVRRYLYMMALDIVESDEMDASAGAEEKTVPPPAVKAQPVPAEEAVASVKKPKKKTAPKKEAPAPKENVEKPVETPTEKVESSVASDSEIAELKAICGKLLDLDPEQEDFVQQIAEMTKGFTEITSEQANTIMEGIQEIIEAYGEELP